MKELNPKQKLFAFEVVQCFNATQAYLKVYGGKKASARSASSRLLSNDNIQAEIKKLQGETRKYFEVGFEDYVNYLLKVTGARISDFVNFGNRDGENFVELKDADFVDDSAILELKTIKGDISIKLEDKKWAWEKLAKIFGFEGNVNDSDLPVVFIDNLANQEKLTADS